MAAENEGGGIKVEVIRLVNHLKAKMGMRYDDQDEGFLPEEMIQEADDLIVALCQDSPARISKLLSELTAHWEAMRALSEGEERQKMAQMVFTLSHEIKDIGAMCGYPLVAYFAESLRDYIARTEVNIKAQQVIVQAHLDAMYVVSSKALREDAGPEAEELKRMVKIAIDKYS